MTRSSQPCRVRCAFQAEGTESAKALRTGDSCVLGTERRSGWSAEESNREGEGEERRWEMLQGPDRGNSCKEGDLAVVWHGKARGRFK